jgi:antirestriction protein ArdC
MKTANARNIMKGEKAIGILAPAPYKIKAENEGEEDKEIMYFKEMKVFDISQVEVFNKELAEGSNIPEYKEPTKLSGDEAKELYIKSISTLINEYKMNIAEESISRGNGYYSPSSKAIRIEQDLEYNHKFKTLIHELAHHIYNTNKTDEGLEIAEMELKAETTAYMVCQTLGIDSSDFSFEYLAAWGKNTENVVEKFLKNYKDILDGVNEIIEKIGA